jgi:menaquinone-9 beta-reductase
MGVSSGAGYDAIIVGGGPAGSTCARFLVRGGARVAVIDRAEFPRVKLCGGWLSRDVWDALEVSPRSYPGGLWEWDTCHVRYGGEDRAVACRGWFIRRVEWDDFLLRGSGAELVLGVAARNIGRDGGGDWAIDGAELRAPHLVGAGGTHCPVARLLDPPRPSGPVGVQEHEFRADRDAVARARVGRDGEPELYLHDDLRGYSWNVPKTDWANVGSGTVDPHDVRAAWLRAREHFLTSGHIPAASAPELEPAAMKGHSYYLYDPAHLEAAARVDPDGRRSAVLVGDSLGLAQPLTAEGILPAVISGRLAAEAILAGEPASYPARLRAHPVLADYRRIFRLRHAAAGLGAGAGRAHGGGGAASSRRFARRLVVNGFAWMFSGARLPAPRAIDVALAGAERWLGRRAKAASPPQPGNGHAS